MTSPGGRLHLSLLRGSGAGRSGPPSAVHRDEMKRNMELNLIQIAKKEISWYSELPTTSPTLPLIFLNDPKLHSRFQWPSEVEILQPNSGFHALRVGCQANAPYLAIESRFCELIASIQMVEESDDAHDLIHRLHEELIHLNYKKELQWAQQQDLETNKTVIYTGRKFVSSYLFLLKPH